MKKSTSKKSWLDEIDPRILGIQTGGDVIDITIGDHATYVAAGKNVTQTINQAVGQPQADDQEQIAKALMEFKDAFSKLEPTLNDMQKYVGQDKINTLEKQLSQKEGDPSGDLIREAGNWLLENIPDISEALLSLFLPAPVGRIIARTGERTVKWLKELRIGVHKL